MDRPSGFLRRTPRRTFRDRREAGRALAEELAAYRGKDGLLVLGLARGGVPVGWEVAAALGAELDVFLVRKLGVPQWPELAMGALATGGGVVMNDDVLSSLHISDEQVHDVIDQRDGRTQSPRARVPRRPAGRRPARQDSDRGRRRHRHRCEHARRGARACGPAAPTRSSSPSRWVPRRCANCWPARPMTWCVQPRRATSRRWDRFSPTSIRSATTRFVSC